MTLVIKTIENGDERGGICGILDPPGPGLLTGINSNFSMD